jgi:hypothetical protein
LRVGQMDKAAEMAKSFWPTRRLQKSTQQRERASSSFPSQQFADGQHA